MTTQPEARLVLDIRTRTGAAINALVLATLADEAFCDACARRGIAGRMLRKDCADARDRARGMWILVLDPARVEILRDIAGAILEHLQDVTDFTMRIRALRRISTLPAVVDHGEISRTAWAAGIPPAPNDYPFFFPEPYDSWPLADEVFFQDGTVYWCDSNARGFEDTGPVAGPEPAALYEEIPLAA